MSLEIITATKVNLIQMKKTLIYAESGRDILERKRDILMRELRNSVFEAEKAREDLIEILAKAYRSLREARMVKGSETVENVALGSSIETSFLLDYRSTMGVTVPVIEFQGEPDVKPDYGFANTSVALDKAFKLFYVALDLLAALGTAEGVAIQLANDIKKTQRRVNALNQVIIPNYRRTVTQIETVLEERELEEFIRTKRIKNMIQERQRNEFPV